MSWLEIFGFVTALLLGFKSAYNLAHFVYTTFLGRLLGHGIELRKCGPWAGKNSNVKIAFHLFKIFTMDFFLQW